MPFCAASLVEQHCIPLLLEVLPYNGFSNLTSSMCSVMGCFFGKEEQWETGKQVECKALPSTRWACGEHGGTRVRAGMNSGVMLFRRGPWMRDFLEQVAALGRIPEPELGKVSACTTVKAGSAPSCKQGHRACCADGTLWAQCCWCQLAMVQVAQL